MNITGKMMYHHVPANYNYTTQPAGKRSSSAGMQVRMPIKDVKGNLIKAGKQEDPTELMMYRILKGKRIS